MKSRSLHLLLFLMLLFSAVFPLGNAQAQPAAQGASESHEGVFSIVWGNTGDHGQAVTLFFLHGDDGVTRQIFMDEELARPFGGVLALNRKRVTVRGAQETMRTPQGDRNGLRADSIDAPTVSPNPSAAPSALVSGSKPWVSIMCKFNDDPAEPKNLAYFQGMFSSSYPGFDHYWQEQSYGTVNVAGSTAVGWFTLPQPRFYYVYDMDGNGSPDLNHDRAADDCTKVADDAGFNFSNIQGINLMFNANLDGSAWGGSWCVILDGVNRCLSMTWEPPWGYENIAVISHEMGHGFGLPHSSGKNYLGVRTTYNNRWDVMSDIWTDCGNSTHATYGCLGQGIISYHKDLLGWIPSLRKFTAPGGVSTITLEQLTQPAPGNYLMAQIPIGSTGRFYTVEVRSNLVGYDIKLPGKAVIIHEVWPTGRTDPADVVDADGNGNTGDAGAMWTVGETFSDVANGISVRVDSQSGTSFVVTITTPGPPPTATAGIYDDKATVWAYTGTWTNVTVPSAYSGAYKTSSTVGASATVYFTGVQAKLYYTQNSTMGKLDVYIDNVKVTSQPINQYSLAAGYQKTWLSAVYPDGVHKIEFRRVSGKVNVDALQVIPAPPPPVPVGPGTYQNNNINWVFTGAWASTALSSASGGSVHTSSTVSNSASLLVTGASGFTLRYFTRSGFGTLGVYVDNVWVTTLTQSSGSLTIVWTTYTLALTAGTHTIKLVDASDKVNFDNIIIAP